MKKLLTLLLIACAASLANAAQCQWVATGIAQDPAGTALNGYTLYLCDAAVWSIAEISAGLANGDFSKLSTDGFVQKTAGSVAQGTTGNAKIASTQTFGDYAVGAEKSFYTLILNGDTSGEGVASYFMTSALVTAKVPAAGALQMSFANISTTAGASEWTPTPEPTSGMLLLLGMAGLALRRKRV